VVVNDAVTGDDHTGSIVAPPAVHEYRPEFRVLKDGEDAVHHAVRQSEQAGEADADVVHAGGFHLFLFSWFVPGDRARWECPFSRVPGIRLCAAGGPIYMVV
jgi:hypothetical protein